MTPFEAICRFFTPANPWSPAWIRDEDGEVFPAEFRIENGHVIVRTHRGRMVEGYHGGATSRKQIAAWWPAGSSADLIQWVAASAPAPAPSSVAPSL